MDKEHLIESIKKIKQSKERKFSQSVDLIINLKNFNNKKNSINLFLNFPHKVKDVKAAAFLNNKSKIIDTITPQEFDKYKDKKDIKKLAEKYDFFLSSASLMPSVASSFGRYLGPSGKMPNPQFGVIKQGTEQEIKTLLDKLEKIARVRSKEPSLKFMVGKQDLEDEKIADNILTAYNTILKNLPNQKENIKSIMIKLTMSKPIKLKK